MNFPKPAVGMLPNDRLDYSAITKRKPLKLPKGARMVVWTITNVEEWDPTQTMPRTVLTPPAGGSPMPDIPNWVGTNTEIASDSGGCCRCTTISDSRRDEDQRRRA